MSQEIKSSSPNPIATFLFFIWVWFCFFSIAQFSSPHTYTDATLSGFPFAWQNNCVGMEGCLSHDDNGLYAFYDVVLLGVVSAVFVFILKKVGLDFLSMYGFISFGLLLFLLLGWALNTN